VGELFAHCCQEGRGVEGHEHSRCVGGLAPLMVVGGSGARYCTRLRL